MHIIFIILKWILIVLFSLVIFFYITCPIYEFPEPEHFAGSSLYNPYREFDTAELRKSNFQVQSYSWFGLTDGRRNKNNEIFNRYESLDYDIISISDYMKINRYYEGKPGYLPVYEHGYSIFKYHQILIGASRVTLRDYPLFQNRHHKQHIINMLKRDADLVYIAHPKLRSAYSLDDMRCLTGYDGIEVLNHMRMSGEHWDAALSAGRYVTILGNDDSHDIDNPLEVGHRCTYIISTELDEDTIVEALKNGNHYAADIYNPVGESFKMKILKSGLIPKVTAVTAHNDTIWVQVTDTAIEFRFIGQMGKIMERVTLTDKAFYLFKPGDTYIRTEILFPDKTILMLNPVVRYDGKRPGIAAQAEINWKKTAIFWSISWATALFFIFYYLRRKFKAAKFHASE